LGIFPNLRRSALVISATDHVAALKNKDKIELARPVH
jgi:hypothetical protein